MPINDEKGWRFFNPPFFFKYEPISKRPLFSDICVPDERDLSTGSNFIPRNTQCIPVFKIFAFLDLEQISADFEIEHFETASYV